MGFLRRMVESTSAAIDRPGYLEGLPTRRGVQRASLRDAILASRDRGALVVEFKRRSPGARTPVLPTRTAREFVAATCDGATAYSCIASRPEFDGSPADVLELGSCTDRPLLFKDFIIDPVQIEAAARAGASAVLLIARLEEEGLLRAPLTTLASAAHGRGLEVVLEWHRRAELRRTEDVPADVYGVNVRDLDTLEIQRPVAEETIRAADRFRPLLGLSGVEHPEDAARFWATGVDGILVGSSVARAADPGRLLRDLPHRSGVSPA